MRTLFGIFVFLVGASHADAQSFCKQIDGAVIVATDGTFLGSVSSKYDDTSIFNRYGDHGSKYSDESMFNEYSDYGSRYSDKSAFNEHASDPPLLVIDSSVVARVTQNKFLDGAVSPYAILACQ